MLAQHNSDPDSPAYMHPYLRKIYGQLQLVEDVWRGKIAWYKVNARININAVEPNGSLMIKNRVSDVDWQRASFFLPQEPHEPETAYLMRLQRSVFDCKFREFIQGDLAGLLSNYSLIALENTLTKYQNNVDTEGNSLDIFLGNLDCLAARDGMVAVLTEMPSISQIRSNAEAIALEARPYWIAIKRCDLTFVKTSMFYSRKILTSVGIKRVVEVPHGMFGVKYQERYRIFELVVDENKTFVVYYEYATDDDSGEIHEIDSGRIDLPFIPITFYSLTSLDPFYGEIPLYDLAELNIEHYQVYSEIREALHATNNPTPVINDRPGAVGSYSEENELFVFGPNTVLRNYDVDKLEFEGKGIEQTMTLLERIEKAIEAKGLSFITGNHVNKTATEVEFNANQTESKLTILAKNKESAFQQMAIHWAAFMGETQGAEIIIDKDLIANISKLSPEHLLDAMSTGALSRSFTLDVLNKNKAFGEVLPSKDIDLEIERST